jgi:hypothetical protein
MTNHIHSANYSDLVVAMGVIDHLLSNQALEASNILGIFSCLVFYKE